MAIVLKVNWVDQSDAPEAHRRIRHIGGSTRELQWKHSQAQAVQSIERGTFHYYVEKDARALKLEVGCAADGCKFLKTAAEDKYPQLLLNLPECPPPDATIQPEA